MTTDDIVEISPDPTPARPRRRWAAIGLVLAVVAAGSGVAAWAATRDAAGGGAAPGRSALGCPGSVAATTPAGGPVQVPSSPTASDVDGRLVPTRPPEGLIVCEYVPVVAVTADLPPSTASIPAAPSASLGPPSPAYSTATDVALTRSRALDGADARAAALKASLQQATVGPSIVTCSFVEPSWPIQYLVGITYDDGVVWVASPDGCLGVTNGDAHSDVDLGPGIAAALADGPDAPVSSTAVPVPGTVVPPSGSTSPEPGTDEPGTDEPGTGTPGTGTIPLPGGDPGVDPLVACVADAPASTASAAAFVPFTPTAVRICHATLDPSAEPPAAVAAPAADAADVVTALAALPVLEPDVACTDIGGERWALLFTGADGAAELVTVDAGGCGTASNGVRVAKTDAGFLARLDALG